MYKKDKVQQLILQEKLLPLYYHDDAETSLEILKTLYRSGVKLVEYTNRGKFALQNFKQLRSWVDDNNYEVQLGAGTIKTTTDAQVFIDAGADFIVCPVINADVAKKVNDAGLLWIPGCMTATEIFLAETNGAAIVKIFPGSVLGTSYITAIKELFPNLLFMPTGGVDVGEENLFAWFKAGVCAVGLGSKLISQKIIETNDYKQLETITKKVLETVRSF